MKKYAVEITLRFVIKLVLPENFGLFFTNFSDMQLSQHSSRDQHVSRSFQSIFANELLKFNLNYKNVLIFRMKNGFISA